MDFPALFGNAQKDKLTWGSAIAVWDIGRYKIVGLPLMELLKVQAKDVDLKSVITKGIDNVVVPHIKKVQDFFRDEGIEAQQLPERKQLDHVLKGIERNDILNDVQIARLLREILRFGLELDMRGLIEVTRKDIRKLVWGILTDDHMVFELIIDLKTEKNWLFNPPTI